MKILLYVLLMTVAFASEGIQIIPFDWSGQFGYINRAGAIFWNSDWRSNRLLFDGTWSIYPRMYGPQIEDGFSIDFVEQSNEKDSASIDSHFQYDQGDYLLDRFLFTVDYGMKERHMKLHGFKRTYAGSFNQYSSGSLQPQQQSYLFNYYSKKGEDNGGFSLGHFNTYSGFPDSLETSLFDNRITTSNIFWERSAKRYAVIFTMDHFLQRYYPKHSSSLFSKPRFLNRNQYQAKFTFPLNNYYASFLFSKNNRSIKIDASTNNQWNNLLLKFGNNKSTISLGIFIIEDDIRYTRNIEYENSIKNVRTKLIYKLHYQPVHPYYILRAYEKPIENSVLIESISGSVIIDLSKSKISATLSHFKDDSKLFENDSSDFRYSYGLLNIFCQTNIVPYLDIQMNYNIQKLKGIYSGGIGKSFELAFKTNFKLFNGFMLINLNGELKHFRDRFTRSYLNPIEMVPITNSQNDTLEPINILNASIKSQVSKFVIAYEWYNISELIFGSFGSEENNYFLIHPDMPNLGRQVNLSITWMFQD